MTEIQAEIPFEDLLARVQPMVDGIAAACGKKANKWGGSAEDMRQEFATWIYSERDEVHFRSVDMDEKGFDRWLAKCLWNVGHNIAFDLRAQAGGQDRATAYFYTRGELRELLDCVFDSEKWLNPPQHDGPGGRSQKKPAEGNNWVTTLADVARGFDALGEEDRELLRHFHQDKRLNVDVAELVGVTPATASYRHNRAIDRLLKALGGPAPRPVHRDNPWQGRHSVSNSQARAMTDGDYE